MLERNSLEIFFKILLIGPFIVSWFEINIITQILERTR